MIKKDLSEISTLLPEKWQIFINIIEDINYKQSYSASFGITGRRAGFEGTVKLNLCTGMLSNSITECLSMAIELGTHIFGKPPQNSVCMINADGELEETIPLDSFT